MASKTKRKGMVVLHSLSRPWVAELPRVVQGWVWPAAAAAVARDPSALSQEFKGICAAAGIETEREAAAGERRRQAVKLVTFHSLRHTFVTELVRAGMSHRTLVEQGNWANEATPSKVYDGAKEDSARRAATTVAEAWDRLLG